MNTVVLKPDCLLNIKIFDVLNRMPGVNCELFAMDEKMMEVGRDALNAQLILKWNKKT